MDAVDVDDADTVAAGRHAVHGDDTSASSPPAPPPPPPARCLPDLESSPGLRRRRSPTSSPSSPSSPSSAPFSGDVAGLATFSSDDGALVAVRAVDDGASVASAARRDDPDDGRRTSSGLGATWSDDDGGGGYDVGIDEPAAGRRSDGNGNGVVRLPRRGFWRSYDTVIMLSICSVVGIVIRAMSATWYRLEIGAVFSEDSALGTNLPLNVWSCFLLGLLCSGR